VDYNDVELPLEILADSATLKRGTWGKTLAVLTRTAAFSHMNVRTEMED
jgi:hypothetical protein